MGALLVLNVKNEVKKPGISLSESKRPLGWLHHQLCHLPELSLTK